MINSLGLPDNALPLSDPQASVAYAAALAALAHANQTDKGGRAYITHPARIAAAAAHQYGASAPEVVLAWLHDVVEDSDATLEDIARVFGEDIAASVDAITHRKHEPRADYYARVRRDHVAKNTKLLDVDDNTSPERLALLDERTRARLLAKYAKARAALA